MHPRLGALNGRVAETVEVNRYERVGSRRFRHRGAVFERQVDVGRAGQLHSVATGAECGFRVTGDREREILLEQS